MAESWTEGIGGRLHGSVPRSGAGAFAAGLVLPASAIAVGLLLVRPSASDFEAGPGLLVYLAVLLALASIPALLLLGLVHLEREVPSRGRIGAVAASAGLVSFLAFAGNALDGSLGLAVVTSILFPVAFIGFATLVVAPVLFPSRVLSIPRLVLGIALGALGVLLVPAFFRLATDVAERDPDGTSAVSGFVLLVVALLSLYGGVSHVVDSASRRRDDRPAEPSPAAAVRTLVDQFYAESLLDAAERARFRVGLDQAARDVAAAEEARGAAQALRGQRSVLAGFAVLALGAGLFALLHFSTAWVDFDPPPPGERVGLATIVPYLLALSLAMAIGAAFAGVLAAGRGRAEDEAIGRAEDGLARTRDAVLRAVRARTAPRGAPPDTPEPPTPPA